jgi:hypothetical protein
MNTPPYNSEWEEEAKTEILKPSTPTKLDEVREACMIAKWGTYYLDATDREERRTYVPRLADVLLAIDRAAKYVEINSEGWLHDASDPEVFFYNLGEDDLSKASPETIDFLHQLLVTP